MYPVVFASCPVDRNVNDEEYIALVSVLKGRASLSKDVHPPSTVRQRTPPLNRCMKIKHLWCAQAVCV